MNRYARFSTLVLLLPFIFPVPFLQAYDNADAPRKVLALSSAIIDHLVRVDDEQFNSLAENKGSWAPIDYDALQETLKKVEGRSRACPGGSGVNVLKGLAHLGNSCAVVGKVGSDKMGDYFVDELSNKGIVTHFERGKLPTGQAICLITPDGQRTFRTYLGASHSLSGLRLDESLFENVNLFHIEGYQLVDPDLVRHALQTAKQFDVKISLDLANSELIKKYKPFIREILKDSIDIVFCNQDEAQELTGLPPREACAALARLCPISVVTMSEKGCWTGSGETQFFTPAFAVEPIDTTGAGDFFASGFLHGLINGSTLQSCALQGSLVASYVVADIGTELCQNEWQEILFKLKNTCFAKNEIHCHRKAGQL